MEEAVAEALSIKAEGNARFASGDFDGAVASYSRALGLLPEDPHNRDAASARATLLSNRAAAKLKLGEDLEGVVRDCTTVLGLEDSNKKARFRRAEALQRLGRNEEAMRDLAVLCRDCPDSREFAEKAKVVRSALAGNGGGLLPLIDKLKGAEAPDEVLGTVARLAGRSTSDAEEFCCNGGLDAMLAALGPEPTSRRYAQVCSAISSLSSSGRGASALCAAFMRDRIDGLGIDRLTSEEDLSALLGAHEEICLGLGGGEGEAASSLSDASRFLLSVLERTPRSLKGHCVRRALASRARGIWGHLLATEASTLSVLLALLSDGRASRGPLLRLIKIAKDTLGMERLKAQVLAIMSGGPLLGADFELTLMESALLIEALFILMPEEGNWLLEETPAYSQLVHVAQECRDPALLGILSSVLSHLASNKAGQAKFQDPAIQDLLKRLSSEGGAQARANSLLILAKIAKNEGNHAEDEGIALEALALLRGACHEERTGEGEGNGDNHHSEDEDSFVEMATSLVEVLVFMVDESTVKDHVAGEILEAGVVSRLCRAARSSASLSFGLSRIFAFVLCTRKEMEAVPLLTEDTDGEDQEARKMARQVLKGGREEEEREDTDDPRVCSARKVAFMRAEGVACLPHLLRAGSPTTRQQVAVALFHCASEQALRPRMVQQGALGVISRLLRDEAVGEGGGGDKCKLLASHALARILISINPALLDGVQLAAYVGPLLVLIARDYALQQFEGLLALTNLATAGAEIQDKIVSSGFATIEDLQFSQNEMVVRAATELLCNCVSCEKVLGSIKDTSRQKLWVSLSFADDRALALAAAGALAMASGDPTVSVSLVANGSVEDLLKLARSRTPGMSHRACVALENVTGEGEALRSMGEHGRRSALREVEAILEGAGDGAGEGRESLEQAAANLRG